MFENEKIVETKTCKHCQSKFEITDKDLEFYDKVSPIFQDRKYLIPTPTLCPDCRQQRRLSFRNERKLYKRKCDATGKPIISMYSPDKPYKVYEQSYWWSDNWNALDYGRDFDFNRGFFEQFDELMREVPEFSLVTASNENSDYVNHTGWLKNCYLTFQSANCEDCYYCSDMTESKKCTDCIGSSFLEIGYECIDCNKGFNIYFCLKSNNCRNSYFLISCENCENCFGCISILNKRYCIFNEQYSKEEYFKKINEILKQGKNNLFTIRKEIYDNIITKGPQKSFNIIGSENSIGNNIINSLDCKYSFEIISGKNVNYSQFVQYNEDVYDCTVGFESIRGYYNSVVGGKAYNNIFCVNCFLNVSNLIYCKNCVAGSKDLFGCIGLRNKQYCILNKQYTKEEYEILVPKIIEHMQKTGEWGEFFPSYISPFGYNETVAMEYFPLSREVALQHLYKWSDYEAPFPKVDKIIPAKLLPENIADIPDDILNRAIECEVTKKPFRIIAQELEFYRKHNLPIPKRHPDQRHLDRMSLRNPRKLFDRKCDKCGKDIKTTYSPDRKEIVYCEECYNKEVY